MLIFWLVLPDPQTNCTASEYNSTNLQHNELRLDAFCATQIIFGWVQTVAYKHIN